MTVTPELTPELEKRIVARATVQGLSVEAYLLTTIEAAAAPASSERASLEEFERAMDALAKRSMTSRCRLRKLSPERRSTGTGVDALAAGAKGGRAPRSPAMAHPRTQTKQRRVSGNHVSEAAGSRFGPAHDPRLRSERNGR